MKNNKYPWLDWLRFLAAFIVVLGHSRMLIFAKYADLEKDSQNIFTSIFFAITRLGNEAVLMFFVMSGFFVGGIAFKRLSNNTFDLKNYVIDRTSRIMIPLIPSIVFMVGISLYLSLPINYLYVIGNIFALQNILVPELSENAALWTLGYEIWFYFFIAAIGMFNYNKSLSVLMICLFLAVFTKLMPHYFICWLIGVISFLWKPGKSYKLLGLGLIFLIYGCVGRQVGRGSESLDIKFLAIFLSSEEMARIIFSVGFALLIQQLILIKKLPQVEKIGTILASFSYTLYLIHFPIIHLFSVKGLQLKNLNLHSLFLYFMVIATSILVSLIMYFLFEGNTNYIRKKLKNI